MSPVFGDRVLTKAPLAKARGEVGTEKPRRQGKGEIVKGRNIAELGTVVLFFLILSTVAFAGEVDRNHVPISPDKSDLLAHNVESLSIVPGKAEADSCWYVTESGYVAAVEENLLDRAIFWAGMGDAEEFERFIESNPLVFPLRSGLRVKIDKFSFSDKVRIRPDGSSISVWTVREAIRSELMVEGS